MRKIFRQWFAIPMLAVCLGGTTFSAANAAELIMFEQVGCGWCERWDAEIGAIYSKTEEGKRAPVRKVDIHDPLPKDLVKIKPGRFTPTFVLMDGGVEIGRIRGYPGEDFFWGLLGKEMEKLKPGEKTTG